jgi:predicted metalloprotease with PDZ domain
MTVRYTVFPNRPHEHRIEVRCCIDHPDPQGQRFSLPAWIPGSYLIRDFARNIVDIHASSGGRPLALCKLDKHSWQAPPLKSGASMEIRIEVHAWDLSVRGAHFDQFHGFCNGTQLFLRVHGQEDHPCEVDIRRPPGLDYADWQIACGLDATDASQATPAAGSFGIFAAADYASLLDHPFEMGSFERIDFVAGGVPHCMVLTGAGACDLERLRADLTRICDWQIALFGKPAPFARYVFMATFTGDAYGGLEHRNSTALLAARDDLPQAGANAAPDDGYLRFLGLCSHEYFHSWNVKRIRPRALAESLLEREAHTPLLWFFEGFTSYYDDLALLGCGLIDAERYLGLLAKTLSQVHSGPGRRHQSVAESSFDAWTKYYRPDDNTPNAVVSYYTKGSLIALAIDLRLRADSEGKTSLDDLMRTLWQRFGRHDRPLDPEDIFAALAELGGKRSVRFLHELVEGRADIQFGKLFKPFGVKLSWLPCKPLAAWGLRVSNEQGQARITHVIEGSPAQEAGLAAGDLLLAISGLRVTHGVLEARLSHCQCDVAVAVHAFRQDRLRAFHLTPRQAPLEQAALKISGTLQKKCNALLRGWLRKGKICAKS